MGVQINCTEAEEDIFNLIRSHAKEFGNVTPRVAGGWVRDKIMGHPSFDMDIALENISGYKFAAGLMKSSTGQKLTEVHVIKDNPEKSKHLETAVVRINGFCVDFVNLRNETYSETRIPNVNPGTPQEDAFRRDLTINSLFYNLFTKEVEDYTGRGIDDIKNKLLITPLDPRTTLFDDPLRLVRIFRFHSKLGFKIDGKIEEALMDERIKRALGKKVSNERIHIEIFKILHYPRGQYGLLEIVRRGYVSPVFKPPVERETPYEKGLMFCETVEKITNLWGRTYRREILNLYTVLCFFSRSTVPNGKSLLFSNAYIMKISLPSSRRFVKTINKIEESLVFLSGYDMKKIGDEDLIRIVRFMGETWYESLVIYSAIEYIEDNHEKYEDGLRVVYSIIQQEIGECYLVKPIIDTRCLAETLGIPKSDTGFYIEESVVYQLLNRTSEPEEIINYLRRIKTSRNVN
ncbi:tRNA nucleotidyltransferase/poly(A) polymerase [Encephalitozoon intestinalis ATCC 50506]|uniref:tRNA nucleotidyltransferase/poly(A) polymerase n=1 Tax=Encephalitozoon intestinalis (strain ATCC 50506) TaxID=876142 RepID=E0S6E2_ENCIT|nr:tRNA nucleotidyltransferase/poly(A) polymerase [Encephalitozoon intestinalis ATCC 50506]ADM11277.1 tRNA nucleotidyltransferase/poly(A) polymerase [Encephalitozoon intestinalis ATCC 50506]UTX44945.1 tRNA nucleotidyltransferase/poly(A) polymerase [Encephalitozoon intestinalis]